MHSTMTKKNVRRVLTYIGPREISILRKAAVPLIYGPQSQCVKGTWYSQVSYKSENAQLFFSRDVADHKRRKRAWDRGFSVKGIHPWLPHLFTLLPFRSSHHRPCPTRLTC
jgi:hypothetical protein